MILYIISLTIALSPIGEWILRFQMGCKEITRKDHINRIEPLYREAFNKAKKLVPSIPDDIHLYITDGKDPNAFATGRKTICLTEGLLGQSDVRIKAVLGHEFGHIAHKDTDLLLIVLVGNTIFTIAMTAIKMFMLAIGLLFSVFFSFLDNSKSNSGSFITVISNLVTTAIVNGIMWVWTKIGVLLIMKSSRENEYEADEFSFNLGYGNALCEFLQSLSSNEAKGVFAVLSSTHPDKDSRIGRLQALGATYPNG